MAFSAGKKRKERKEGGNNYLKCNVTRGGPHKGAEMLLLCPLVGLTLTHSHHGNDSSFFSTLKFFIENLRFLQFPEVHAAAVQLPHSVRSLEILHLPHLFFYRGTAGSKLPWTPSAMQPVQDRLCPAVHYSML